MILVAQSGLHRMLTSTPMLQWPCVKFSSWFGSSFTEGPPPGVNFADLIPTLWNWSPDAQWSLFLWRKSQLWNVTYCTLEEGLHLHLQSGNSLNMTEWETWRLFESCELPLMAEKQRCDITWIFLQVFNQTKDGTFSQRYHHQCFSWSDKTSVSVLIKTVAITSVWSIGLLFNYYSTVL